MPLTEQSLNTFTLELATAAPTPGGGGVCALTGALGAALGSMVGALTAGKKKYAAVEAEILALNERAAALRTELLSLVERDAAAFAPLAAAYGVPRDTPGRDAMLEDALRAAAAVPLEIMETAAAVIPLLEEYEKKGSALAVSDAGVGALCVRTALCGASLNVFTNTKLMKDRGYAAETDRRADALLSEYLLRADAVYAAVSARLRREGA